ncbi:helix-turn-helix domain-containing protein [uncultured Parasphingopyxis sp.]|uniref:helix-turn-helix domain-containing protein n=1 Tax=uncultured Parasphingopyxis sp. TaxID=1547918 RepID=UPI00262882DA|nr:helix-turn-helix domain-containing protein [uncultured Parasphingopyxis sp.]
MEPKLLSIADTAKVLGVGRSKLYAVINDGDLDTVTVGRRRLVTVASIERFVERLQAAA